MTSNPKMLFDLFWDRYCRKKHFSLSLKDAGSCISATLSIPQINKLCISHNCYTIPVMGNGQFTAM